MDEETGYLILDVRTKEEYDEGHIPDSVLPPNETIDAYRKRYPAGQRSEDLNLLPKWEQK